MVTVFIIRWLTKVDQIFALVLIDPNAEIICIDLETCSLFESRRSHCSLTSKGKRRKHIGKNEIFKQKQPFRQSEASFNN